MGWSKLLDSVSSNLDWTSNVRAGVKSKAEGDRKSIIESHQKRYRLVRAHLGL
jgi:hypothetical protein